MKKHFGSDMNIGDRKCMVSLGRFSLRDAVIYRSSFISQSTFLLKLVGAYFKNEKLLSSPEKGKKKEEFKVRHRTIAY